MSASPNLEAHVARGGDHPSTPHGHRPLRFYDTARCLARIVVEFLREGFDVGSAGIVIATAGQRAEIVRELTARSFDVDALQRSRDLLLVDGDEHLSTFMVDGAPDPQKFREQLGRLIERAGRSNAKCPVRIFGHMVDVLWQKGDRDAAVRLELLWNQLARREAASVVCGYAIGNFFKDARFESVCEGKATFVSVDGQADRRLSTASDTNRGGPKRGRRSQRA